MQIRSLKLWHAGVSSVVLALAAAAALSAAAAQDRPPAGDAASPPSITLPPLPDVTVKLNDQSPPVPAAPAAPDAQMQPPSPASATEPAAALPPLDAALKDVLDQPVQADRAHSAAAALRKEREAIAAFYAQRNYAPLWLAGGVWTEAAKSALARLEHADDDGLDIKSSTLPTLVAGEPAAMAATELALSEAIVIYGREASGGRIDPRTISPLITEKPQPAEPADILGSVANAADAGAALEDFNPPQAGYKALRQKLAELRHAHTPATAVLIPGGPILKVGMKDPRVPLIRARFGLDTEPAAAPADLVYDTAVAAVAGFQRSSGLPVSGTLTPRTIAALSGGQPSRLESEILVNMERWRWLSRDIGSDRIDVNIPDFTVSLVHDDVVIHRARVVVGKPDTPTPIFSNAMQYIEVNPYWNVPQSIVQKEMLPHLAKDPTYLQRQGYEVTTKHGQLIVRQPPGERNALGRIKFMFPNEHAVYLHDTPAKSLFATSRRAYSHGCVRVDQPLQLAALVLGKDSGWTEERIQKLVGGANRTIHLPKALPIHIEYFTAWVDETGKLQLRDDIYGYSHKMKLAMGLQD